MATLVPPPAPAAAAPDAATATEKKAAEKVDYMDLPCPIPYEELHREVFMSLKPDLFEGLRFDFTKGLNQRFSLTHSVMLAVTDIPNQPEPVKVPESHYEFGANFIDPKLMLFGRIMTDGRLSARVKCDVTENLTMKANAQISNNPLQGSHGMVNFDYKGTDYRTQFQLGSGALFGASYIQSVTPHLSLGAEAFWAGQSRRSGLGYAARYNTDKTIATAQIANTGMVALGYVHKVSEKVSLASDLTYQHGKEVTASFGYDYILRQCRLRGKLDSNGCVSAFLEERLNMGLNFILSAEIDHVKKNHKFGFGLTVGEF